MQPESFAESPPMAETAESTPRRTPIGVAWTPLAVTAATLAALIALVAGRSADVPFFGHGDEIFDLGEAHGSSLPRA